MRETVAVGIQGATLNIEPWAFLFTGKDVVIAMDDDEAGWKAAENIRAEYWHPSVNRPAIVFPIRSGGHIKCMTSTRIFDEILRANKGDACGGDKEKSPSQQERS